MEQWAQSLGWWLVVVIFASRVCDVSLGTLRIIFIARQRKALAAGVGFFEVLIWLVVITLIFRQVSSWLHYLAYAGGFALGTYVGILIEGWLAVGTVIVRVITQREGDELVAALRQRGVGVTMVPAEGSEGPVHVLFSVVRRRELERVLRIVRDYNPRAFYTVEHVHAVSHGIFPVGPSGALAWPETAGRKGK
jgi:uncharacterized protein YebE (UPF0316 family)